MKITANNKIIEADVHEVIELLGELINTEKLLKYGEILIQFTEGGATITTIEDSIIKEIFEIKDEYSDDASYEKMKTLASICNTVSNFIGWNATKHSKYRMRCGITANDDESSKKIEDIIGTENLNKLYEAGYNVVED